MRKRRTKLKFRKHGTARCWRCNGTGLLYSTHFDFADTELVRQDCDECEECEGTGISCKSKRAKR